MSGQQLQVIFYRDKKFVKFGLFVTFVFGTSDFAKAIMLIKRYLDRISTCLLVTYDVREQ